MLLSACNVDLSVSLKSSTCLDSKRHLVYADKTIDLSSSHGVHYLVHYSAL